MDQYEKEFYHGCGVYKMSGPKGGTWVLEHERAIRLKREQQIRLAREIEKKQVEEKFNQALKDARSLSTDIEEQISVISSLTTENIMFDNIKEEIEKKRAEYDKILKRVADRVMPGNISEIKMATEKLVSDLERIKKQFAHGVTDLRLNIMDVKRLIQSDERQKEFSDKLAAAETKKEAIITDFAFRNRAEAEDEGANRRLQEIIPDMDFCIRKVEEYVQCHGPDEASKREAAETAELCKGWQKENFKATAKEVSFIEKQYRHLKFLEQRLKKDISAFDDTYANYSAQCREQELDAEGKAYFKNVKELKKEVARLEEAALEKISQNYVKEQVADIMENMGYSVINNEILRPQRSPGQNYYQFDDDSAIRVSMSDEGTMMMEILGIGDDLPLNEGEIEELVMKQGAFCRMHPIILNQLEERGIFIKNRIHAEPHRDFAKKAPIRKRNAGQRKDHVRLERKLGP